jgi:FkbM family methyltransferase
MNIIQILSGIVAHPFNRRRKTTAIIKFFVWQFKSRLFPKRFFVHQLTENSRMYSKSGMTGVTGCIYNGLLEYNDMVFAMKFLRSTDTFIDIGANVGVYSILASAEIGASTICFEPIPQTYFNLVKNIDLNSITHKVNALNIGLGSKNGNLSFTKNNDTVNHVATLSEIEKGEFIQVDVRKLDDVLNDFELGDAIFVKIDVEGFETEVLKGADNLLKNNALKGVIIELNGSGERYSYDENWIHNLFIQHGFSPYSYNALDCNLNLLMEKESNHNTIYLREINFVKERLDSAKAIYVQGRNI